MSSFLLDAVQLWQRERSREGGEGGVVVEDHTGGREWVGVVYVLTTLVGGLGLVWMGREGVRRWERKGGRKWAGEGRGAAGRGAEAEAKEEAEEQRRVNQGRSVDAADTESSNGEAQRVRENGVGGREEGVAAASHGAG